MRHKEVHVINAHPSMKFALDFGMSLITEKIRQRFRFYTNLDEALNAGYLERDVLPKEYGGEMPMQEMIGKKNLQFKIFLLNSFIFRFVES